MSIEEPNLQTNKGVLLLLQRGVQSLPHFSDFFHDIKGLKS